MTWSRREFLAAAGAGALALGARHARAEELTPGQYPLNLDRSRDGLIYVPRGYKAGVPMPLIVMCHGAGGSASTVQYTFPFADEFGAIVLATDSRDERTWDLVLGEYGPDLDFLMLAVGQVLQRCAVDRQRMTIAGHSDGASYALSFGITNGDVFGRIMAFSAGVMRPADARGKPKLFISHGTGDKVMPIDDTSRKFVPKLRDLGYEITYREYDGGHGVPTAVVREGFEWWAKA